MGTDRMWQSYRRAGYHLLCCFRVHGSPLHELSWARTCVGCCEQMMDKVLGVLELVFQQGETDRRINERE